MGFPYFADEEEVAYILEAEIFVANHGWNLLPQSEYDPHNRTWRYVSRSTSSLPAKKFLTSMQLDDVKTVHASV
ncbi:hypothetical protein PRNP1_004560 [Phytophthora ramorum]